jgi:hypothetical protein
MAIGDKTGQISSVKRRSFVTDAAGSAYRFEFALLLIVGLTKAEHLERHRRLTAFALSDCSLLLRVLGAFQNIAFCPNVLTETSILIRHAPEPMRSELSERFRTAVVDTHERYIKSATAVQHAEFARLGLTDAVLLHLSAAQGSTLLTTDLDLYASAIRAHRKAINFNHLREASF